MLILMMMLGVRLVIGSEISWQGMELGLDGFGIMTRFLGWIRSISMKIRVKISITKTYLIIFTFRCVRCQKFMILEQ